MSHSILKARLPRLPVWIHPTLLRLATLTKDRILMVRVCHSEAPREQAEMCVSAVLFAASVVLRAPSLCVVEQLQRNGSSQTAGAGRDYEER